MTEIFNNGFEEGNFSAWTATGGTPVVQSTTKHHGTYAMENDAVGDYAYKSFSAQTTVFLRVYFRMNAVPTGTDEIDICAIMRTADSAFVRMRARAGVLRMRSYVPNISNNDASVTWQANTWYCVEVKGIVAASCDYRMWLDGVEKGSRTGENTTGYTLTVAEVGNRYGTGTYTTQIDCVVAADAYIGVEGGVTNISVSDSGAGSEVLGKLRELGVLTESGSGLESVTTPERDIVLLDQATANEVLDKLRTLGVISDSALGIEGEVQVLLVGSGIGTIIVLVKRSAGISLSTSLPKTISLDVSKPAITLRVNPDAN
jgi:hypothetical protein